MREGTVGIPRGLEGATARALENGHSCPEQEPVPRAAKVGALTRQLGILAPVYTTLCRPYASALLASITDSPTRGRFGWTAATSPKDGAANNYGLAEMPEHDLRYELADEFVELVNALCDSWEPGAIVRDRKKGIYIDPSKVHDLDFV